MPDTVWKFTLAAHRRYPIAHDTASIKGSDKYRQHTTKFLAKAMVVTNATNDAVACERKAQSVKNFFATDCCFASTFIVLEKVESAFDIVITRSPVQVVKIK
jgi:hypothetical protein